MSYPHDDKASTTDPLQQAKETLTDTVKTVKENVVELKERGTDEKVVDFCKTNAIQLVTAVAVVGILINNRRSFKFTKKIVKNMDKNMVNTQRTIETLKSAGQEFTFYPGIGVWVE